LLELVPTGSVVDASPLWQWAGELHDYVEEEISRPKHRDTYPLSTYEDQNLFKATALLTHAGGIHCSLYDSELA
jgi:hypothetical protein